MRRTQEQLQDEMVRYKVYQENNRWYGCSICQECKNTILYSSLERGVLLRNIRNLEKRSALCCSCNKKCEKNHFFGKKHSELSNIQNSNSHIGKACGEKNVMAKQEHRDSVSRALLEKYKSGELDFLKKIQRQTMIKSLIDGKLKTTPVSNAERELKVIFESKKLKVITQFSIHTFKYDLFLEEHNILIEYNGDYWHCNPKKYKPDYFHQKKKLYATQIWEKDKIKKELAEKNGYKLFIILEKDYMFNKEKEINKIISNL